MHPIQMQEGDRGIGMGYTAFINRFEAICQEHLHEGRARAFGVDPLPWTCIGLILKPFRVLSGHARRHLQQHQTALRCSFQSSGGER